MIYSIKLTDGSRIDVEGESNSFVFTNFGKIPCMEVRGKGTTMCINVDHIVSISIKEEKGVK